MITIHPEGHIGTEWKEDLLKELGISDKLIKLNELLVKYDSDLDRLKEWTWSKQTYYAYKKMVDFQTKLLEKPRL